MKTVGRILPLGFVLLLCLSWHVPLFADYTLLLKNGRRITVKSYREEGGKIKFPGLGGEIGIAREQVESIVRVGEGEGRGLILRRIEQSPGGATGGGQTEKTEKKVVSPAPAGGVEAKGEKPLGTKEEGLTPEEELVEKRAREEREYLKRVREITEQMKSLTDRYSLATRRKVGSEPSLLDSQEAIEARTNLLNSRLKDRQYNPAGPSDAGGVKLSTPSSFAGVPGKSRELRAGGVVPKVNAPLPAYSAREKELSELRKQINQLQKEREELIQEMRQKNFDTGSLFLE